MSIKVRLILSYIAMLLIPAILTAIAAVIIFVIYAGNDLDYKHGKRDPFITLAQNATNTYSTLMRTSISDPDKLGNRQFLRRQDEKLKDINTGIIIYKSGKLIYSSEIVGDTYSQMDPGENFGNHNHHYSFSGGKGVFDEVTRFDFTFSDKSSGTVIFVSNFSPVGTFLAKYFSTLFVIIIIILILTNVFLTYIISRSIIKPLRQLYYGTEQIKAGNLNFTLEYKSRDEIGQVCRAFEEMRSKLKESIDLQLQYEENRKELISSISHDLKTPITSIKGYVEGIRDGVAETPEKMERYIQTIYTKAIDMDRLIDDLFLFSKLDMKKVPFNFEKVDLRKYFEDSKDELKFDMEKNAVALNLESSLAENTLVLMDRDKIKRVVLNVVENAVKYMNREQGCIEIKLKSSEEYVTVEIHDNGQGIQNEDLPNIFERFYRADQSRNTATGGSGLGLAIAKQIIEGHGGRIWAESEPGAGTSIFFTLKKEMRADA